MTTNTNSSIIVGVFAQAVQARRALDMLQRAGFKYDQIGVATPENKDINLLNELQDFGVPQEQAGYYTQEFQAGRILVSIRPDGRNQEAHDILQRSGAYDYEQKVASSQSNTDEFQRVQSGQGNTDEVQRVQSSQGAATSRTDTVKQTTAGRQYDFYQPRSIKLRGEQLNITIEQVQSGEVSVHKELVTEQRTITVPVTHEEIVVERHAISGGVVDRMSVGEGETIRIPVNEEQINITKEMVVTGEVSVGKRMVQENRPVTETVKHEEEYLEHEGDVSDLTIHDTPYLGKRSKEQA